jgi:hypothetical protein
MKQFFEKIISILLKSVIKSLGSLKSLKSIKSQKRVEKLKVETTTPPNPQPAEVYAEVKEETPAKVDFRATRQIDPRYTKPMGKL